MPHRLFSSFCIQGKVGVVVRKGQLKQARKGWKMYLIIRIHCASMHLDWENRRIALTQHPITKEEVKVLQLINNRKREKASIRNQKAQGKGRGWSICLVCLHNITLLPCLMATLCLILCHPIILPVHHLKKEEVSLQMATTLLRHITECHLTPHIQT